MSYFVYVLESEVYKTRYIGCCQDVYERVLEHNNGRCRYTKGRKPWKLIHYELYELLSDARHREKFLKSGNGRSALSRLISA